MVCGSHAGVGRGDPNVHACSVTTCEYSEIGHWRYVDSTETGEGSRSGGLAISDVAKPPPDCSVKASET